MAVSSCMGSMWLLEPIFQPEIEIAIIAMCLDIILLLQI